MRKILPPELIKGRVREGQLASTDDEGFCGMFILRYKRELLAAMSSDGSDWKLSGMPGDPWEHVSVSLQYRCPSWNEICYVKDLFWGDDELVIQFHPPKKDYMDVCKYCLHLWKPPYSLELPPIETMAPKEML